MAKAEAAIASARVNNTSNRLVSILRLAGPLYLMLYALRWVLVEIAEFLARILVRIEQHRCIVELWAVSAKRHTSTQNKNLWNTYDWSSRGEEWTRSADWKAGLIRDYLEPNIPSGARVVEIGPGGGRWTDVLHRRVAHLSVVDVSETALSVCRQRFQHADNIDYLVSKGDEIRLETESVDAVWSYDVFVHINSLDTRGYIRHIARILKPGGRAVIHHPGTQSFDERERRWRSDLTDAMVRQFAVEAGLAVVEQTREYVNEGDVMSVLEKPARARQ